MRRLPEFGSPWFSRLARVVVPLSVAGATVASIDWRWPNPPLTPPHRPFDWERDRWAW